MENNLNLATAFAFMACDGDISKDEVALIKKLGSKGVIKCENIDEGLNSLLSQLNEDASGFMKRYFRAVEEAHLDAEESLELLRIAVDTIMADNVVEYSEVKFFRAVRSHLSAVSDQEILETFREVEDFWLEADVKAAGAEYLESDYLNSIKLPSFDPASLKEDGAENKD